MSSGDFASEADNVVDHLVTERGAVGARHREAFGEIASRQFGDVVAAEHARAATGEHHEADHGVDQELVPRSIDEMGVEVDRHVGAAEHLGKRFGGVRGGQHQPRLSARQE
jgi:hypothetical protein